jgi:hypothetical protein
MTPVRGLRLGVVALATTLPLTGCDGAGASPPDPTRKTTMGTTRADDGAGQARPQYVALADAVAAHGARVWVETDLVRAWRAGPATYATVLDTVVSLADRPGVDGVKIADELGYNDGIDAAAASKLLAQATHDIHARLPGRKVMVDMIVPELGCLAWQGSLASTGMTDCAAHENDRNPATTIAAVDGYLRQGGLDVLDLSAGLRSESEYARWGTNTDEAMRSIWVEASRRWGGLVTLQARKALAHPGKYPGTKAQAEADVHTFVDLPLANGAKAVDIWTWGQPYQGGTYQLTDPGLGDNALVEALRTRTKQGVQLWTHMTPSSLQRGLTEDVAAAVGTFGTILVASGTG